MANSPEVPEGNKGGRASYAKQHPRISKEDLFAVMALWMEQCPLSTGNQAGAVFVGTNDRIVAMDCSRNGVHAAARVLINFPDKVKGCTVYMSRKPCSICVKLLVQAEVSRIRFLPFQPETSSDGSELENVKRTENLLTVCPVGSSVYVPNVPNPSSNQTDIGEYWIERLKEIPDCSSLDDSKVIEEASKSVKRLIEWMTKATGHLPDDTKFKSFKQYSRTGPGGRQRDAPDTENENWQNLALHMSRMAQIVSKRTDDPCCSGVGVILLMKNEVVSVGLNGYASKAKFGDFPRSNKQESSSQKYPYLIHAEQNALLLRNTRLIADKSTTAFISRRPCDDCMSLLVGAGVNNVVLPEKKCKPRKGFNLLRTMFDDPNFEAFGKKKAKIEKRKKESEKRKAKKEKGRSSIGDQFETFGHQSLIFSCIGDSLVTISGPASLVPPSNIIYQQFM